MKFLHLADLHIGKVVNGFSMLADQAVILEQITELAKNKQADAVLIAGDVYDRPIPPAEAVELLDVFLTGLVQAKIPVLIIAGNHDSGVRLKFAEEILEREGVWIAGSVSSPLKKVTFRDSYGEVTFFLLPFFRPAALRETFGEAPETTQKGMHLLLEKEKPGGPERRVLAAHCFATAGGQQPELSDSETGDRVGGVDAVDASLFSEFDYVALGHLHKPQQMGSGQVYYAGSPLKYSFSEVHHRKSVTLVELREKGDVRVEQLPLKPLHDMRKVRGELSALLSSEVADLADREDYLCAVLTNEEELIDPIGSLRRVYPNVMQILLEKNERTSGGVGLTLPERGQKSMLELYREFFAQAAGRPLDEKREALVRKVLEEAGGMEG